MTFRRQLVTAAGLLLGFAIAAPISNGCDSATIGKPNVIGTNILDVTAETVTGFDITTQINGQVQAGNLTNLEFCNVTITYEHPGKGDNIHVSVWLPTPDKWNGRFQGTGGGGWVMGLGASVLAPAVNLGYAAANTDGGLSGPVTDWALVSPGNVNLYALDTFAATGLDDMTQFGKLVTAAYYGEAPKYSYWAGCSTGGRQGLMHAQRYPTDYDGILAMAPAINWHKFIPAEFWPQLVMTQVGYWPPSCEFAAVNDFLMDECDELDGVRDGVISSPYTCPYDVSGAAGKPYSCNGTDSTINPKTVEIVQKIWQGARDMETDEDLWFGLTMAAPLNSLAGTDCSENNTDCYGAAFDTSQDWIALYLMEDGEYDFSSMSYQDYAKAFHRSDQRFKSLIGTDDPDLSEFKARGGKMISWHGLSDQLIFTNGTFNYYENVAALDSDVDSFFRLFTSPGVQHCGGGIGAYPDDILGALVDWVENDSAPETLPATSPVGNATRPLCAYPKMQVYLGGDVNSASSFGCQ
ncbi:hypothetical protein AAFC00_004417 [Neodothiora populina]|uniref:Carboxylic ester hydrolase n=1 Tax=Neodothiora populina TaxID=2781224 RepID=A0ABR3PPJ7_9PEZI